MGDRWSRDQVLALAPDASSQRAAQGVASQGKWSNSGCGPAVVWGECRGSGATPYSACVDLSEPASRCSCPSRKFPCKHALALLLLWSEGLVKAEAEPPDWVGEWLRQRGRRTARADSARAERGQIADPEAQRRRAQAREQRVAAGLDDLGRWLTDQVRQGLAGAARAGYGHWDDLAKRMVDAQAPGVAGTLARVPAIPHSGEGWAGRLLEEYALLHLLVAAYERRGELSAPLVQAARSRIGFTVSKEDVLKEPPLRDEWIVIGQRDTEQDRLHTRRIWLHGHTSLRRALVLSFAPLGQPLDGSLVIGTTVDADLAFYPGAPGLRAVVATRHGLSGPRPPLGTTIEGMLGSYAEALAGDPWLEEWPEVLAQAGIGRDGGRWSLADEAGRAVPIVGGDPWRLVAVSGGRPVTVAGEWSPRGFRPLTAWPSDRAVAL